MKPSADFLRLLVQKYYPLNCDYPRYYREYLHKVTVPLETRGALQLAVESTGDLRVAGIRQKSWYYGAAYGLLKVSSLKGSCS